MKNKIEAFLGRKVDFNNEIRLTYFLEKKKWKIEKWSIKDVPQPTLEELNQIPDYPEDGKEYNYDKDLNQWIIDDSKENEKKFQRLREIRDNLIQKTIWVQQRHMGELQGIEVGLIKKSTTLNSDKYNEWLSYWQNLRDLPENVNINEIKTEEIVETNYNIFPKIPD